MRLITDTPERLTLLRRPGHVLAVRIIVGVAVVAAIAFAVLPLMTDAPIFWVFQAVPAGLLLLGLPTLLMSRARVEIDKGARTVSMGATRLGPEALGAVVTWTWPEELAYPSWTKWHERFWVGLADREAAAPLLAVLDDVRRGRGRGHRGGAAGTGRLPARAAKRAPDQEGATVVMEKGNLREVWAAAEALAKALGLPLVDRCGDRVIVRAPEDLDLSLPELLARGRLPVKQAKAPSKYLEVESRPDAFRVRYRTVRGLSWALRYLPPLLVGGVGLWMLVTTEEPLAMVPMLIAVFGWAVLEIVTIGEQAHTITVDRRVFRYEREGRPKAAFELPLDEIELLRVASLPRIGLDVLGDRHVKRLDMDKEDAVWIRRAIEEWLARRA